MNRLGGFALLDINEKYRAHFSNPVGGLDTQALTLFFFLSRYWESTHTEHNVRTLSVDSLER